MVVCIVVRLVFMSCNSVWDCADVCCVSALLNVVCFLSLGEGLCIVCVVGVMDVVMRVV